MYTDLKGKMLVEGQFEMEREYWLNKLSGKIEKTNFSSDFVIPNTGDPKIETLSFKFPEFLFERLLGISNKSDFRLHITLVTGLLILLYKYTGSKNIIIGAPIDKQDVEGEFINTILPLQSTINEEMNVKDFLMQVKQTIIEAKKNQNYPVETIPYQLGIPIVVGEFPLFDIAIFLQNIQNKKYIQHINLNMIFGFLRTEEYLEGNVEYNSSIFKKETIERIVSHFFHVIHEAFFNVSLKLIDVPVMSEEERNSLLFELNKTNSDYPRDRMIHQLFEEQVERTPGNFAVESEDELYTYKELNEKTNRLARTLREKGIMPDTVVAILLENSKDVPFAFLAVLKAGGAYLPMGFEYPEDRIHYVLKDSRSELLLTQKSLVDWKKVTYPVFFLDDESNYSNNNENLEPVNNVNSLVYIIYTSGTTGQPKGVMIEHKGLVNYIWWAARMYVSNEKLDFPLYTSISFDLTVTSVFTPLITGNTIIAYGGMNKKFYIEDVIDDNRVGIVKLTPSHLKLIRSKIVKESSIKRFIVGGEELETQLALDIYNNFDKKIEIYNEYGPTETVVGSMIYRFDPVKDIRHSVPIGAPIANTRIYLLNEHFQPVPIGAEGELYISGDGLARGYLFNPKMTEEKFVPDPYIANQKIYKTGDLAVRFSDGNIEYKGRIDSQVKIRGYRVETGEIEVKITQFLEKIHPGMGKPGCVVADIKDEIGERILCAYILSEKEFDVSELKAYLFQELPDYMIPIFYIRIDSIPLTPSGKVDRKVLPKPGLTFEEKHVAPRNDVENKLSDIWSEVLGLEIEKISIDANFFEVGGHSLRATFLASAIQKNFDVKLPLVKIFEFPTIRGQAEQIKGTAQEVFTLIDSVEEKEYYSLSSAQKRMYFLQQFDLDSVAYNISLILPILKKLEKEKLEFTLKRLIERHESLRTSFINVNDQVVQKIHPPENIHCSFDYYEVSEAESIEIVKHFIKPFDLAIAPLIRMGIIKFPDEHQVWMLDMHHIVSDGLSHTILTEDFLSIYNNNELAPQKFHYKDFTEWQNRLYEIGEIQEQKKYWVELFEGEIPRLNFPTDYKRPEIFTFEGNHCRFQIENEEAKRFIAMSSEHGGTLYMNMLTALNILFYIYTGQTDIIIGTVIAGRRHIDLQRVMGMFVNTLAMRNYPKGDMSYDSFRKEVIAYSINGLENQDVQFESLVDELGLERDLSGNPLFDVMMVVQNYDKIDENDSKESNILPSEYMSNTSKFDLAFFVVEERDRIIVDVEYYSSIFKQETIERLVRHLKNLIRIVNSNSLITLDAIDIIDNEEKNALMLEFNNTRTSFPADMAIIELFEEQVAKTPDRISVVMGGKNLTYKTLDEDSNRIAAYLIHEKKIKLGDYIGLFMDRSLNMIIALFGILKAGGAYVPLEPVLPVERIKYIIGDANIGVIISEKKLVRDLNRLQWDCVCFHSYLCVNSMDIQNEDEAERNELMNEELWNHVGETAMDEITGGGWVSSYTGEIMSVSEMNEYADNVLMKLRPFLRPGVRVLEIGCASGISMFRLAPEVGMYYGVDLSRVIIERNKQRVEAENHRNIKLNCLAAHEIHQIEEKNFDLVIMNSVIYCFNGHNYLTKVIRKAIDLLGDEGLLFVGDILDQEKKEALIKDLDNFKKNNRNKCYKTKTDFSSELFISRSYWEDLRVVFKEIEDVKFSNKIHTIENELTRFRYDAILKINKKNDSIRKGKKKNQDDKRNICNFPGQKVQSIYSPYNPAYLIYTSGSTGRPKGVIIQGRSVMNLLCSLFKSYSFDENDTYLLKTSIMFDVSVSELFGWYWNGGKLAILEKDDQRDPWKIIEAIQRYRITHINFVPSMFKLFLEVLNQERIDQIADLKYIFLAGEVLQPELVKKSRQLEKDIELINLYGPTEGTVYDSGYSLNEWDGIGSIPIGKPLNNVSLYILGKGEKMQPIGAPGELCIGEDGLSLGYLNRPELSAEKFIRINLGQVCRRSTNQLKRITVTIYKTGDLARWVSNGNIEFLGRIDQQVKIRGFRIELEEIESRLLKLDGIKEAVVLAREEDGGDKYICAYYISDREYGLSELRERLSMELPDYMIPSYFKKIEKIPLTSNGKIDRKLLSKPELEVREANTIHRNEIELELVRLWAEILGRDELHSVQLKTSISIGDNFFELGGHSLKATILVARIYKVFDVKVPLVEIFKTPTIKELGKYIKSVRKKFFISIEPRDEKEYYPLSFAQKRLYILHKMNPDNIAYNMPEIISLSLETDWKKVEEIFKKLIKRHESLRTSFHMVNDTPVQVLHDNVEFNLDSLYSNNSNDSQDFIKHFFKPFDLSKAPLIRVGLIKEDRCHMLIVDMHHIISDGVSHQILINEFLSIYKGEDLLPLRVQYKDFSEWQNLEKEKENFKLQEEYWLKEFEGEIPVLELPTDYPRPVEKSFDGNRTYFEINEKETLSLKAMALSEGSTLFMVLMAIYNILLSKLSGQEEILIGTPIAGRRHVDLEKIIGMFVNTLSLRNCPNGDWTFRNFLREIKERTLIAFENQEYPFEELVEKLSAHRDIGRNPLFDVMFAMQNMNSDLPTQKNEPELKSNRLVEADSPMEYGNIVQTAQFDLILNVIERKDALFFSFEYCTKLFKRETIERFIDYFEKIISIVVKSPEIKLSKIDILSEEEKSQILNDFNEIESEYPKDKTIHRLFEEQVERTPDHIAVIGPQLNGVDGSFIQITYSELNERADRLAQALLTESVGPDFIVAIKVERSLEMIVGILGILKSGCAYLPIDPEYPQGRIEYMLKDSGASILITENELSNYPFSFSLQSAVKNSFPATTLAYVIYTSGSTGKPKAVMVEHHSVANLVKNRLERLGVGVSERTLLVSSICFDASVEQIFAPIFEGGSSVVVDRDTLLRKELFEAFILRHLITHLILVPSLLNIISENKTYSLKQITVGGESCPISLASRWIKHCNFYIEYGPTEATVTVLERKIEEIDVNLYRLPIGKPIPNSCVYILDKWMNSVPIRVSGEIHAAGVGISRGYLNKPELTADKFVSSTFNSGTRTQNSKLYKTGDLGRWLSDGNIEYLGRIDEQLKIRGFRVEPGEIEAQLLCVPSVKEAVVLGKSDQNGEKYLHAYVVTDHDVTALELKDYLLKFLPGHMVPSYFSSVNKIPLTSSGKIDRSALSGIKLSSGLTYIDPRNKIEEKLAQFWGEALGIGKDIISIDSDFFELGGHSLKATILVSKIHKELNVKISLAQIFKMPVIRELSEFIKKSMRENYVAMEAAEEKEYYPLSSAQKRLYFLQQMNIESTSYNIPLIFPLGKNKEKKRLESSLKKLIARHESLRTSFININTVPVQKIHPMDEIEFKMEYYNVKKNGNDIYDPSFIIQNLFIKPFELSRAPLIRSGLIEFPDSNYCWIVDIHHIISDGTSHTILTEDFLSFYNENEFEPLKLQYKDFSEWQNRLFESGAVKAQEDYWFEIFSGEIPRLQLSTDFKRPDVFTFDGARYGFMLKGEDAIKFKSINNSNHGTLYMSVLSVLSILFYKYTGQEDIIIGSGIAGRAHMDIQGVVGMFVNTLALWNSPQGEKTYGSFLREVISSSVEAFENQDIQFEELVERINPERDPSRNPVFDVAMVVQNFRQAGEDSFVGESLGQNEFEFNYKSNTSKVDMTFFVQEYRDDIFINIEYYTAIFRESTIKRISEHFVNIVKAVIQNPSIKVKDIDMISDEEREQVLFEFNRTETNYPESKTIHRLFEEQVEKTPDNVAVIFEDIQVTYRELEYRSNRISRYLYLLKGIDEDDCVGILVDPCVDLVAVILGIIKAGGAYIPIDSSLPGERKKKIIKDSNIRCIISEKKFIRELNRFQWECDSFSCYLCLDSQDVHREEEAEKSDLMNRELWEHIGETAADEISEGGWKSSYTGKLFTKEEMDEYGNNVLTKLKHLFYPSLRVLEIGCSSGISMYRIAPEVGLYYGTDLSRVIIEKNKKRVEKEGPKNIKLLCLAAHEIDRLDERNFDVIIINSVIQAFHGHNYLRQVIWKSINLLGEKGILFLGDIMDLGKKEALIADLKKFRNSPDYKDKDYVTKTDFSEELFLSREFLEDLADEIEEIADVSFSNKLYTIENELTKFRYDALVKVDKKRIGGKLGKYSRRKRQEDTTVLQSFGGEPINRIVSPNALVYIIYTSGTTGIPRGVGIEHKGLVNYASWRIKNYRYLETDITLQLLSPGFDGFGSNFYSSLLSGGKLVMVGNEEKKDYEYIGKIIKERGVTNTSFVPLMYEALMEYAGKEELKYMRLVVLAGEKAKEVIIERSRVETPWVKLMNEYGPTEATVASASSPEMDSMNTGIIGRPISNVCAYIMAIDYNLQPIGIAGELFIGGAGLARGYLNNPEKTVSSFIRFSRLPLFAKTLYKTGDIARWLPGGDIEFLGRVDNQVKIRGFRIELGEIEDRLSQYPGIKDAVVIFKENENGDKSLAAYIILEKGEEILDTGLKDHLLKYLPDYMVPPSFMRIKKIPFTENGKVDRKALSAIKDNDFTGKIKFIEPGNQIEKTLVEIWQRVLGRECIGINDNFFVIGGDSIKSIQIISRMSRAGYKLEIKDLFKYPVISELARYVRKIEHIPDQSEIVGLIPLTPIQRYFFNRTHTDFHHFNQAVMLYSREGFEKETIRTIFGKIQEHHDALRVTFKRNPETDETIQFNHGTDYPLSLEVYDLRKREDCFDILSRTVEPIQESIDLANGPLMKLGLFHMDDGDRLLIVIHHLVIDGISWRILFEDIETLMGQYKRGEKLVLPLKTDSFKHWANSLSQYANSKTFLKEKNYWSKLESNIAPMIPKDYDVEENNMNDTQNVSVILEPEETELLLTRVNNSYRTEINDILLTALGLGIKKMFNQNRISIALEGHGREDILKETDISRTVGWFTSMFPIVLDFFHSEDTSRQIKNIKETLRRIPNKGIGYGIIKYMTAEENKQDIEFKLNPKVSFNYLGQFDSDVKQKTFFEIAKESTGNSFGLNTRREYLIDVSGMIATNRLSITFIYNPKHFDPKTIRGLAENFHSELLKIIEICSAKRETEFTPSDFTYKGLSIESIDRLMNRYTGIEDLYILSHMQEGMLFYALEDDSSYSYFEQMSYRLEGELDISIVEKSLNELFKRHDVLRTVFIYNDIERPVQVVLKDRVVDFYYEDLRNFVTYEEREWVIEKFKKSDKRRGFDLSKGALMRVSIHRIDELEYELIWSFHHILMDGWCLGILHNEFFEIYSSFKENRVYRLPDVKPYRTYIQWLQEQEKGESELYWENYLESFEEPTVAPRTNISNMGENQFGYKNEEVSLVLDSENTLRLNNLATDNRVTVNRITQAIWGIMLGKYNGKEDVVFGAVVSGRPPVLEGVESMIGLFINTVPVRIRFEEKTKFKALVQKIQEESIAGEPYHYQALAEIQFNTELKQNLIDHIMIFENYPIVEQIEGYEKGENNLNPLKLKLKNANLFEQTNYDFNITLSGGNRLTISIKYNAAVFERNSVERIAGHFSLIVDQVIDNQDLEIGEITFLTEEERRKILYEFNDTEAVYSKDKTIQQLFKEQVDRTPDNIAVLGISLSEMERYSSSFKNESMLHAFFQISYKELDQKVDRLVYQLKTKGVEADSIVGIMVGRSIEMLIGILGILKAGGAYLPIDPEYPRERINFILKDSGAKLALTDDDLKNLPNLFPTQRFDSYYSSSGLLAYVIYTSGSTGNPKGVMIEHRAAQNFMEGMAQRIGFNEGKRILALTTISFDIFGLEILLPVCRGLTVVIANENHQKDIRSLELLIETSCVEMIQATPSRMQMFMMNKGEGLCLKNLKEIMVGGEAFSLKLLEDLQQITQATIYNMYGPTETTIWSTVTKLSKTAIITIGNPIINTQLYILDKYAKIQPVGVMGELYIGGAGLARGYLNNPELTENKFLFFCKKEGSKTVVNNCSKYKTQNSKLYRTGDLARWLDDGNIEFLGRIDHQVKIRGFRIELEEIENRLIQRIGIKEVVVISKRKADDMFLCAYLVSENKISFTDLRKYLSSYLPDYMIPAYFVYLDNMPLTPNGKLDKKALPDPEISEYTDKRYASPSNELEENLVEIWGEVLNLEKEKISVYNNFFQLGGHSLKAMALVSKISQRFEVNVPLVEIFRVPTIRELAKYIKERGKEFYMAIELAEEKEYYYLSSAQKRLYILQQMNPDSVAYNIPKIIVLPASSDLKKIEETFRKLIKRHESLRESFHMIYDTPVQVTHDKVEFEMEYYDWTANYTDDKKGAVIQTFICPFDLSRAPLIRALLIKEESQSILVVDIHHIISDGVSHEILVNNFQSLYKGEALPPLRIQYKDFSEWQNGGKEKESLKRQEEYWLKELEGEIPVLEIPIDFPRPIAQSFEGEDVAFEISVKETEALYATASTTGSTLFMVLDAVFNVLLSKLSGQEDIVIGTPIAGRRHADLDKIIGMFVNTLPLRNYPSGEKTFGDFLEELHERTLMVYENQEYPFEELVNKLSVNRDIGRNPLFDVMFALQNMNTGDSDQGKEVEMRPGDWIEIAKFDLTLNAVERNRKLFLSMQYCTKLFKKETIERFIVYFKKIVSIVVSDPGIRINRIELISEEEKKRILFDFNNTKGKYPKDKTVHQLFEEQVEKAPGNIAIIGESIVEARQLSLQITYKELSEKSDRLAHVLQTGGVCSGAIVGIMVERSVEMIIGIMGILKTGAAYLPIDPDYPKERIDYMLKDSNTKIIIDKSFWPTEGTQSPFTKKWAAGGIPLTLSTNTCYVIYTSGTTGKPKGVMIEHRAVINFIKGISGIISFTENDRILSLTTISFDIFGLETLIPLASGSAVLIGGREEQVNPVAAGIVIKRENITIFQLTPSRLQMMISSPEASVSLKVLKFLLVGGEIFPGSMLEKVRALVQGRIFNMYGPTETTIWSTLKELNAGEMLSIGKPIANTRIYIVDNIGKLQSVGIVGELCIGGDGLARGYLNRPELTADKFLPFYEKVGSKTFVKPDTLYRTGDLARWLDDGNIEFLGRIDHQVKIRGYRIELGEIEAQVLKYPGIVAGVVIDREIGEEKKVLCAYLVSKKELDIPNLRSILSKTLPDYMIPSYYIQVEKIPFTTSGKINRKALYSLGIEIKSRKEYVAPRNEIEQKIAQIWKEILKLEEVGIHENFFDIGGTSLDVIRLNMKFREVFNEEETVLQMFRYPTIRSFGEYLIRKREGIDSDNNIYRPVPTSKMRQAVQNQKAKRLKGGISND